MNLRLSHAAADGRSSHDARYVSAKAAKLAGRPVIGIVGSAVPRELIRAAGCFPVGLTARAEDWGRSSEWMEVEHEAIIQSLFIQALDGDLDFCDLIVISGASDGHRYLFQYLREMARRGLAEHLPPVSLYDPLFSGSSATFRYSEHVFNEFARQLEVLAGRTITGQAIASATAVSNGISRTLRQLDKLRRERRIVGREAFTAIGAAQFMDAGEYSVFLEQLVRRSETDRPNTGLPRLLIVSAEPLYHSRLHERFEAQGALVIAENDEWGARQGWVDIDTERVGSLALLSWYQRNSYSPRMPAAQREAWVTDRLAAGDLDGVVFYIPPGDQHFGWSFPDLERRARAYGIPTLLLDLNVLDPESSDAVNRKAAEFTAYLISTIPSASTGSGNSHAR